MKVSDLINHLWYYKDFDIVFDVHHDGNLVRFQAADISEIRGDKVVLEIEQEEVS